MDKPEVTSIHLRIGSTVPAQVEIRSNLGRRGHLISAAFTKKMAGKSKGRCKQRL